MDKKPQKGYLAMRAAQLEVYGLKTMLPEGAIAILVVYKTLKAMREVQGKDCPFMEVEVG